MIPNLTLNRPASCGLFLYQTFIEIRYWLQPNHPLWLAFGRRLVGKGLVLGWSSNRNFVMR